MAGAVQHAQVCAERPHGLAVGQGPVSSNTEIALQAPRRSVYFPWARTI